MTAVLAPAEQAVYRALAPYRMTADQRRTAAHEIVKVLAWIPTELLPGVVSLGDSAGIAGELVPKLWAVPVARRREAAAVAIAAAADVLCREPS